MTVTHVMNEAIITDVQRRVPIWIKKYFDNNESKAGKILIGWK